MRLFAALFSGLAAALLVGMVGGAVPSMPRRRRPPRRLPRRRQWLTQAGLDLTPGQFWMASIGAGLAGFVAIYVLTGLVAVALAPALVIAFLPRAYFARVRLRRLVEIREAWPDGLRDLIASVSAGMSLPKALETLARAGPEPLRRALHRFPVLVRTAGMAVALSTIKEELADPTSDRVIEVLALAHERGGPIVPEILAELAAATTRDVWALEEIESDMLQQKINARVVFVLPWLVLVAMTIRPGPFRDFYASVGGLVVVALGGVLSLVGIAIVSRLAREPEEPRVLVGGGDVDR